MPRNIATDPKDPQETLLKNFGLKLGLSDFFISPTRGIPIKFTGSYFSHTIPANIQYLNNFFDSEEFSSLNSEVQEAFKEIPILFQKAKDLATPGHSAQSDKIDKLWEGYQDEIPTIILSGLEKHGIIFILYKEEIYECNRGLGKEKGKNLGITKWSYKNGKIDKKLIEELHSLVNKTEQEYAEYKDSSFTKVKAFKINNQLVGNCSQTSLDAALPVLLSCLLEKELTELKPAYKTYSGYTKVALTNQMIEASKLDELTSSQPVNIFQEQVLKAFAQAYVRKVTKPNGLSKDETKIIIERLQKPGREDFIPSAALDLALNEKILKGNKGFIKVFQEISHEFPFHTENLGTIYEIKKALINENEKEILDILSQDFSSRVKEFEENSQLNLLYCAARSKMNKLFQKLVNDSKYYTCIVKEITANPTFLEELIAHSTVEQKVIIICRINVKSFNFENQEKIFNHLKDNNLIESLKPEYKKPLADWVDSHIDEINIGSALPDKVEFMVKNGLIPSDCFQGMISCIYSKNKEEARETVGKIYFLKEEASKLKDAEGAWKEFLKKPFDTHFFKSWKEHGTSLMSAIRMSWEQLKETYKYGQAYDDLLEDSDNIDMLKTFLELMINSDDSNLAIEIKKDIIKLLLDKGNDLKFLERRDISSFIVKQDLVTTIKNEGLQSLAKGIVAGYSFTTLDSFKQELNKYSVNLKSFIRGEFLKKLMFSNQFEFMSALLKEEGTIQNSEEEKSGYDANGLYVLPEEKNLLGDNND